MVKKIFNNYMINTIITGPIQTIIIGICLFNISNKLGISYIFLLVSLNILKFLVTYLMAVNSKNQFILLKKKSVD